MNTMRPWAASRFPTVKSDVACVETGFSKTNLPPEAKTKWARLSVKATGTAMEFVPFVAM